MRHSLLKRLKTGPTGDVFVGDELKLDALNSYNSTALPNAFSAKPSPSIDKSRQPHNVVVLE
jgi:hypothetical protein